MRAIGERSFLDIHTERENAQSEESVLERRHVLKALGYGPLAILGATGLYPLVAEASPSSMLEPLTQKPKRRQRPIAGQVRIGNITIADTKRLRDLKSRDIRRLTLRPKFGKPRNTSITSLGGKNNLLTSRAKQLTKNDLLRLGSGRRFTRGKLGDLTMRDIKSIKDAFGGGIRPGGEASVSCCCCTPCCCAASVTHPSLRLA